MKIQMLNQHHHKHPHHQQNHHHHHTQQNHQQQQHSLNYSTKNPPNNLSIQKQYFFPSSRLTRIQLNKINLNELRQIAENLTKKVEKANSELMALLEARDTLSMKRDALAIEVQDLKEREEEKLRRGHQ